MRFFVKRTAERVAYTPKRCDLSGHSRAFAGFHFCSLLGDAFSRDAPAAPARRTPSPNTTWHLQEHTSSMRSVRAVAAPGVTGSRCRRIRPAKKSPLPAWMAKVAKRDWNVSDEASSHETHGRYASTVRSLIRWLGEPTSHKVQYARGARWPGHHASKRSVVFERRRDRG